MIHASQTSLSKIGHLLLREHEYGDPFTYMGIMVIPIFISVATRLASSDGFYTVFWIISIGAGDGE